MTLLFNSLAFALPSFVVRDIKVQGAQRIQLGTVLNYVPINVGQRLRPGDTSKIISSLFRTGFFTDVSLAKSGNTLIIKVVERPTIGAITIRGNREIKTEPLQNVMRNIGLTQGQVFNRAVLDKLRQEMKSQYNNRGRYNATVTTKVTSMSRNRVRIDVIIAEGTVAKIREIRIIGNRSFTDKILLKQFILTTPSLLTYFNSRDQYSKEKLDASLEALKSYYMDRGFIKMRVDSAQVSLTPNHKDVYITVRITEGARYHFNGYRLAGKFVVPKRQLDDLVPIRAGDVFARNKVSQAVNDIGTVIGDAGYGFPKINPIPKIDDKKHTVFLTIYIDPGIRAYIRRIDFSGNHKTADYVLRHNMKQKEGALLSISQIKESERKLRNLQYFKNVAVKTRPAPGTNNQVDLEFTVTEVPSTTVNASVGYGTMGVEFNTGINEPNFLGTGRTVGLNFSRRSDIQNYAVNFYDPFFAEGIGQGFNLFYTRYTPGRQSEVASYATNRYGGELNYSVSISDYNTWSFSGGFTHLDINSVNSATPQYAAFIANNGRVFNQIMFSTAWHFNSFDQIIFPNSGYRQSVSFKVALPTDENSLYYFKAGYTGPQANSIGGNAVATATAELTLPYPKPERHFSRDLGQN